MRIIVDLALLSIILLPSTNAQATLEQWYVHLEASPENSYQQVSIFLFAPFVRLSTWTNFILKEKNAKPRS